MQSDDSIIRPDPVKCGAGQGAECCVFLAADRNGFCCERYGQFHDLLVTRTDMSAKRKPVKPYPECQEEKNDQ